MAGGDASTGPEVDAGFEFAFDNETFSNKVLRIEVVAASRKRRREGDEGGDEEDIDSSCTVMGTPIIQVKTIHVSSVILAAKSSFFLKLFSNGMKESGQTHATVRIADSEETAFMELLGFMYSGKLTPTEPTLLLDILMAADKFEVVSCMKLCGHRLIDLPMNLESAVRCLDLPCCISMAAALQEAAQKFFAESERYKKFPEFQDELMRIPFPGIMAILTRNDLEVASEVAAYDFVIRWACSWYPNSEESRRILSSFLIPTVSVHKANALLSDFIQSMKSILKL
ncbi:BTB/POZ domain-containing protein POB1-like [Aegilops tauschii subsp. strangulata]|uniref:BTB/POZ domain-containing protein POB1-like n=1 Tax=Aegilops tauschii subsp. strangulata TaxID=200361 RepID=UPI00098B683F|nr:BTB/POZ domain-containing protein POB1-like [Aegilops tauschii subsp. strangulata]